MALVVKVKVGAVLKYLLGWRPSGDDPAWVVGDSRIAWLDELHPFARAGIFRWHDAATVEGSQAEREGWPAWRINRQAMMLMLDVAKDNTELISDAYQLHWQMHKRMKDYYTNPEGSV